MISILALANRPQPQRLAVVGVWGLAHLLLDEVLSRGDGGVEVWKGWRMAETRVDGEMMSAGRSTSPITER